MKVVFSNTCLKYEFPFHPESPRRVKLIKHALEELGFSFTEGRKTKKSEILLVHAEEHYERVKEKTYLDPDTPPINMKYPLISAGTAIKAAKLNGFALTRPPGHHAGRNFLGGFCYFNNIAIAIRVAYPNSKVAVLDLDVHHGNGTQDIFLGDSKVLYISIHQFPLYPGTGKGSVKNCLNFPLPPGTGERTYVYTLRKALKLISSFNPHVLAISLGFDTYERDPLANFKLKIESYAKIARIISEFIREKGPFYFIVLEGGYSADLGKIARSFFSNFSP